MSKKYWTGISNDELRKTIRELAIKKAPCRNRTL
jgi:hypothetical protein